MRKLALFLFICICASQTYSQVYPNSWIQYGKSYYKFSVAEDGLYHISQNVLNSIGLANVPAEQFQLWRNGEQQPIYTTVQSGVLGSADYIEFWGIKNDGKADTKLYMKPEYQLSDRISLQTDTAAYFLTVNASGGNFRFVNSANNTAGNTLAVEPYFMNVKGFYYKTQINPGYGIPAGDVYLYSSSYDQGEGWSSRDIKPSNPLSGSISNVYVYAAGPSISINYGIAGSAYNNKRDVSVTLNSQVIATESIPYMTSRKNAVANLATSLISNPTVNFTFANASTNSNDRIVASHIEIKYPSVWNFGNQTNFYFELPATAVGNYLEITNFNTGGTAPVLLDMNSRKRYIGDISTSGKVKFVLPSSAATLRGFRLISSSPALVKEVVALQKIDFVDYAQTSNQGNYLIISNKALFDNSGVNNVEAYRAYRSSAAGGNFNAKVIDIDQLVDQFAYGIKKHPRAIKDFIAYAKMNFSIMPKNIFIIGRGVAYNEYVSNSKSKYADQLNLVPSFGSPASDMVLAAPYGSAVPTFPVGRISVVNGEEVGNYLEKIKEHESALNSTVQTLENKLWMKNVVQTVGGSDEDESDEFQGYMNGYNKIISDTLYGAHVELFNKTSNAAVQLLSGQRIEELFKEGISLLSYFGHSSANTLAFNLSDPYSYDNTGKYPVFLVSGCTAGNNFVFDTLRIIQNNYTISENFVNAKQRGTIAFVASTHFGLAPELNAYNTLLYKQLSSINYQGSLGQSLQTTIRQSGGDNENTAYFTKIDYEENNLNGDPAIRINPHPAPDYVVEESLIKLNPSFISISEQKFDLDVKTYNIGKAVNDSINFEVKRTYPSGNVEVLVKKRIKAPNYVDSLHLTVPIIATRDKGSNKITVTIDSDNEVAEMSENNNSFSKEFYVFEDEARPAYPSEYAIINTNNQHLFASTANLLSGAKDYDFEMDTTELFNSSSKISKTLNSVGGLLEFDPGISYKNNTVYYWRVANRPESGNPEDYHWNKSSFLYLSAGGLGAGQSHFYQHLDSDTSGVSLTNNRMWKFGTVNNLIESRNGVYPSAAKDAADFAVSVNGADIARSVCGISGIIFNVINPETMIAWTNTYAGRFGSDPVCAEDRLGNFQFNILDINKRKAAMDFLNDSIPDNYIVVVHNISGTGTATNTYAADWKADEATFGTGKSLYLALKNQGFSTIDQFDRPRSFIFMYQKNSPTFNPTSVFSSGISDNILLQHNATSTDSVGTILSPKFGPALEWKQMSWEGSSLEQNSDDNPTIQIIGSNNNGVESVLFNVDKSQKLVDISSVDAKQYPFIQLKMRNIDSIQFTPYQLDYWRLNFTPAPEGALHPQLLFTSKDSLQQGEPLEFGIAFKNISFTDFDSVKVKISIIDKNNVTRNIAVPHEKPLVKGDTILFKLDIDTKTLAGNNTLYVDFNPDNDQPEQYHFNNFLYKDFYVQSDVFDPLLDVTFDGVHILNQDIVSSKPHILIKLKDESKYLALDDTAMFTVQIRFPDGILHDYHFDNDTMKFIPADLSSGENAATIDLQPTLLGTDAEYELIVSGKDAMGNRAGELDYHINFKVISKPMISNMLNYPNPFTTSTAFVFTVTGSEVPQNIRIQILTITGKVIREITTEELGPIHIGRNITEFKWDGTDMYGDKVANGVYLYRVLTNLNGASLDKYKAKEDDTDQYFIKGYGKMYFMR